MKQHQERHKRPSDSASTDYPEPEFNPTQEELERYKAEYFRRMGWVDKLDYEPQNAGDFEPW